MLLGVTLVVAGMVVTQRTGDNGWWSVLSSVLVVGGGLTVGYGWRQAGARRDRQHRDDLPSWSAPTGALTSAGDMGQR